ncbi:MAG: squalene synthase HpnD [Proteobacteria bacterium]|nr:MAG: squalene synthase HpnD [Pseudomonadota bacterium]
MRDALDPAVAGAYQHCAAIVRQSGSSFAAAFWLLGRPQRRAIHAVYAFCRLADDIADDPSLRADRSALLARWRAELDAAYDGAPEHPVAVALGDAVRRYALPRDVFVDLLRGIESDLRGETMERFDDLELYCHRVASTVGLVLVRVLGARHPSSLDYAEQMGIAVQLTNVLRDVGEDASEGRIYLAREDLARLGVHPDDLRRRTMTEPIRLLLALYAERARLYYERAERALPDADRRALRPAQAMGCIYRRLLDTLHAQGFPCLERPVRLSKPRRIAIAASAWLGLGAPA